MIGTTTALQSLLGRADAEDFAAHYWPENRYLRHGPVQELAQVLRSPLLLDPRRLARVYRGPVEVTKGRGGQYRLQGADPAVYFEQLDLAVRFSNLETLVPEVPDWLRQLECDLGAPRGSASLHSFVNARGIGLGAHCDPYEHIVIQLIGNKTFRVLENPYTRFMKSSFAPAITPGISDLVQADQGFPAWRDLPPEAETVTLRPGSVMFTPRGVYHETRGGDGGPCVTLVVQINLPSYADVVTRYLSDYLQQREDWRRPIAGGWGQENEVAAARETLQRLLGELAATVGGLSCDHMLRARHADAVSGQFEWGARLYRNPAVEMSVEAVDEQQCRIEIAPRDILQPPIGMSLMVEAGEVLGWIGAQRGPFDLAKISRAFSDWETCSLEKLLRFLLRHRVLLVSPIEEYVVPARSNRRVVENDNCYRAKPAPRSFRPN